MAPQPGLSASPNLYKARPAGSALSIPLLLIGFGLLCGSPRANIQARGPEAWRAPLGYPARELQAESLGSSDS